MKSKRNIIILTIAVLLLSISTVYAITIIRASDVTYDTSKSNGSSTNVQGAIDELYDKVSNYKEPLINENMISYITDLAKSDTTNLVYDDTADKNLRYIGSNPNNYVEFNGELWRIIGVMNNVKDATGNSASRIKLIRNESIGKYSFDTKPSGTGSSTSKEGSNDWTDSSIMKMLNQGVYWNRTSGSCPYESSNSATNGTISCDLTSTGLTEISKSMITKILWNLGAIKVEPSGSWSTGAYHPIPSKFYTSERSTSTYSDGTISRASSWIGYVGLMYPSDYGYSTGGNTRQNCLNTKFETVEATGDWREGECKSNSWIFDSNQTQRTISADYSRPNVTYYIHSTGFVGRGTSATIQDIRPVVYLDTNLLITKGKGTLTNPYKISFEKEIEESTSKDETKNLITKITNLAVSDTTNLVSDDTVDKNIRYIGKNPNNYIKFNDELWRIIGIMNNVKDSNGITSSRVKIIRDNYIGEYSFDNKSSGMGSSTSAYGSNDWTDSTIMKMLNQGVYWNRTIGTCYNGINNSSVNCDFSNIGLTSEAKEMISKVTWNLGGRNNSLATASTFYKDERGTLAYDGRPTEWSGYVGLMYPSDYGYAVGGNVRSVCLSTNLSSYNNNNCYTNDWLYFKAYQWTISPRLDNSDVVFFVYSTGIIHNDVHYVYSSDIVRPVVYLNTDIEVTSGDGSIDNPYIIKKG